MAEKIYEKLEDREIVTEHLRMKGIEKIRLTENDMTLFYALSEYGILYAEDAAEILQESKKGRRRTRLKNLDIIDGKRGIVYLGSLGREMLRELNLEPRDVKEFDKITEGYNNELANRYRKEKGRG